MRYAIVHVAIATPWHPSSIPYPARAVLRVDSNADGIGEAGGVPCHHHGLRPSASAARDYSHRKNEKPKPELDLAHSFVAPPITGEHHRRLLSCDTHSARTSTAGPTSCATSSRFLTQTKSTWSLLWETSEGWMRCFSIIGKFVVTMMALIALVSTTRFSELLIGLQKLGVPRLLVIQLGFLYRYIFVLIDRAHHILRARAGRRLQNLGFKNELKIGASMVGSLLIRSIETAEQINIAMQARGFDGNWRTLSKLRIRRADLLFFLASAVLIVVVHFYLRPVLQ